MSTIIRAHNLGRWYGEVVGLGDLNVEIGKGITGLVGPNGAGKSTFMKLMVGEICPSRGEVEMLGMRPFANRELYKRMGFCPQQDALYDHMSARRFVATLLRISGYGRAEADDRAVRALDRVGLKPAMERKIGQYSKGMRQRTRLAQSIAHDPEVLVADEPLTGLDPIARRQIMDLFTELGEAGHSIVVSSHVLHEVQSLTDKIVLIHRGRLLAQGSVPEIRRLLSRHPRRVKIHARDPRKLAKAFIDMEHVGSVKIDSEGTGLSLETRDLDDLFDRLPALASELRAGLRSIESSDSNLEAVFDYLVE